METKGTDIRDLWMSASSVCVPHCLTPEELVHQWLLRQLLAPMPELHLSPGNQSSDPLGTLFFQSRSLESMLERASKLPE